MGRQERNIPHPLIPQPCARGGKGIASVCSSHTLLLENRGPAGENKAGIAIRSWPHLALFTFGGVDVFCQEIVVTRGGYFRPRFAAGQSSKTQTTRNIKILKPPIEFLCTY